MSDPSEWAELYSDIKVAEGALPVNFPAILGHEGSGIVVNCGKDVKAVQEGDHVLLSWVLFTAIASWTEENRSCTNFACYINPVLLHAERATTAKKAIPHDADISDCIILETIALITAILQQVIILVLASMALSSDKAPLDIMR